jgi:hypothetical protein
MYARNHICTYASRGKTVVHWQASRVSPEESLWQLCCLNDRFALDGLSPPSYGGVLWCYGWQDKPSGGSNRVSEKWAHRYRTGPSGFLQAKEQLLLNDLYCCDEHNGRTESSSSVNSLRNGAALFVTGKRTTRCNEDGGDGARRTFLAAKKTRTDQRKSDSKSIMSYFSPATVGAKRNIG